LRDVLPSGKDGRILKEDILQYLEQRAAAKGLFSCYKHVLCASSGFLWPHSFKVVLTFNI